MKICGIDPGIARVGWAFVEDQDKNLQVLNYGCLTTNQKVNAEIRLLEISHKLQTLLLQYKPDVVSLEELYFASNAKTAITVGQARGVIMLMSAQNNIPVVSYSPLMIKQTICGYGKADKQQIQKMVVRILHLSKAPEPDDAADALAIALTHAYSYQLLKQTL